MAPDIQVATFPPFVAVPEELALLFDDELRTSSSDIANVSDKAKDLITEIDNALDTMSSDPSLWTPDRLSGSEWSHIRTMASSVLRELNVEAIPPKLPWLTYRRG